MILSLWRRWHTLCTAEAHVTLCSSLMSDWLLYEMLHRRSKSCLCSLQSSRMLSIHCFLAFLFVSILAYMHVEEFDVACLLAYKSPKYVKSAQTSTIYKNTGGTRIHQGKASSVMVIWVMWTISQSCDFGILCTSLPEVRFLPCPIAVNPEYSWKSVCNLLSHNECSDVPIM